MKKIFVFLINFIIIFSILLLFFSSCKKDMNNYYPQNFSSFSCREFDITFDIDNTRIDNDEAKLCTLGEATLYSEIGDVYIVIMPEFLKDEIIFWDSNRIRDEISKDPVLGKPNSHKKVFDENAWFFRATYEIFEDESIVMTVTQIKERISPYINVGDVLHFDIVLLAE